MKKAIVLAAILLLAQSAFVTSQPFTASIVVFPACGSQFMYGQKAFGQITVSDDAWVTRWVEDQWGNTWYHWGTRYYPAGSHSFSGYMGLPIGVHVMKIYAVRVSDGAIAEEQCQYTVCCGYMVFMPDRPSCNCEDVEFTADVDKTQVTPGDYVTVTVTVTNNMEADCKKRFDAGHLEIDWGILGGDTSPLENDLAVHPGETRTILEETHLIPPVPEGDYNVVIFYSDSECTWIDYTTMSVVLPTEASFEILSYPDVMNVDENGRIKLLVRNKSEKQAQFTLLVTAPPEIYLSRTMYTVTIPKKGYAEFNVAFIPEEVGFYTIGLEVTSEDESIGTAPISFKVEKPVMGKLDIVSPPDDIMVNESTSTVLRVTNPGQYDTVYQISAAAPGVQFSPIPELYVPGSESREAEIFVTPVQEGMHEIVLTLEAEGQLMDSRSVSFSAETPKGFPLQLVIIAAVIGILALLVIFYLVKMRSSP